MKKSLRYLSLALFLMAAAILRGQPPIPKKPNPPRLVNDFANLLTPDEVSRLESTLVNYDDTTSVQITIVTVPDLGDYPIEDWALEIGKQWGVGQKEKNNGVVILVSTNPRKINISTGYGMEGVLPDLLAKRIISNEITPNFKEGRYYDGLDAAITAIRKAAHGEYNAENATKDGDSPDFTFWFIIIVLIIIILYYIIRGRNGYAHYGSDGGGWIYWGGGSSGSSWGGGSSDSGDFGGFGGGDFGGGGASGDW